MAMLLRGDWFLSPLAGRCTGVFRNTTGTLRSRRGDASTSPTPFRRSFGSARSWQRHD